MTVARLWIAEVDRDRAPEYESFARDISIPMFRSQPGYCGALMMRDGERCLVLTLWESGEAADALRSSASYNATVDAIRSRGFLFGEQKLELFPVHLMDGFSDLQRA
jgi:heme-degrading monooxygenase HmoA